MLLKIILSEVTQFGHIVDLLIFQLHRESNYNKELFIYQSALSFLQIFLIVRTHG